MVNRGSRNSASVVEMHSKVRGIFISAHVNSVESRTLASWFILHILPVPLTLANRNHLEVLLDYD